MTTPRLIIPDVSEWQGFVEWETVARTHPAAIIRVYNGSRADQQFARNRAQAHEHGIHALGLYAYLSPEHDIEHQAAAFVSLVGHLQPGEWPILDYEASGLHSADIMPWFVHVSAALHGHEAAADPWLYTGEYLYRSQNLGKVTTLPAKRTWLAAYGAHEPDEGHALWQYTSHGSIAGVHGNVDLSVFHGTLQQLQTLTHAAPAPAPHPGPTSHPRHPFPAGIHPGGSKPSARPLQQALKVTGWMAKDVKESDQYGPKTQESVGGFNRKHGLNSHGVKWDTAIGPHGWALLMTLAYGPA